ncbi:MAG: 2TM domain-containing protein [Pseudomonadota bacterium]
MNKKQAKKRINELKVFYAHLVSYVAVSVFLFAINMLTSPGFFWFLFPVLGWGIGIAIHAGLVFWTGHDWERRKMEELTGLKETRDELQKLAERTDTLARIMASVDWEKIDPELRGTRQNLDNARAQLVKLREEGDPTGQEELAREIAKIEEFVTSPRFDFYELAAEDRPKN